MTLTLTYEDTLSRVKISASSVGVTGISTALTSTIERSLDGVIWTTVRCGAAAPVVSGVATIYDYEFVSGVVNYYRATTAMDMSFVSAGTAAHGNNASVSPGIPAGGVAGDTLILFAAIRNFDTGVVNVPTGWTNLITLANVSVFGKTHSGSESSPTVTFTGGVANASTSAQIALLRNVQLGTANAHFAQQFNSTAQNVAYPALTVTNVHALLLYLGWRQNDHTSVATLAGDGGVAVEVGEPSTTLGDDQGLMWDACVQTSTTPTNVVAGQFVVTGGAAAFSRGIVMELSPTTVTQSSSITPVLTDVWLKSIGQPFLNRRFTCVPSNEPIERGDRTGIFEVIGRSYPVAVTDLRQSRETTIEAITRTTTEWQELDLILSAGQPMFVHTPLNYPLPSMYVVIGRTSMRRPLRQRRCADDDWRVFTLPLREVAAPGADVCGTTVTWQSVLNTYATWQAVINGETSWLDLLENVGTPADVIVT